MLHVPAHKNVSSPGGSVAWPEPPLPVAALNSAIYDAKSWGLDPLDLVSKLKCGLEPDLALLWALEDKRLKESFSALLDDVFKDDAKRVS